MEGYESLDEVTRQEMVAAFDEALRSGQVVAPDLMNDEGKRRFPSIVREALLAGTPQSLFQGLGNASFWTIFKFGFDLTGFGMKPTDWLATARRVSDEIFLRWYQIGLGRRRGSGSEPDTVGEDVSDSGTNAVTRDEEGADGTEGNQSTPADADTGRREPFELTGVHYHPRHPNFFVQFTPGYLWFTNVPGGGDTSIEVRELPLNEWIMLPSASGRQMPVALRREDGTILAKWQ